LTSLPPLAERLRPSTLDDLVGQQHLTGKGSILRKAIEQGKVPSMILWGPPGVGKTTIANIIANTLNVPFYTLSAISSVVKEDRSCARQRIIMPVGSNTGATSWVRSQIFTASNGNLFL